MKPIVGVGVMLFTSTWRTVYGNRYVTHPLIVLSCQNLFVVLSEFCQISKMERFAKIANGFYPLTIFAKRPILDI